jgi:uncharacterized protein YcbK (DUF882 family)
MRLPPAAAPSQRRAVNVVPMIPERRRFLSRAAGTCLAGALRVAPGLAGTTRAAQAYPGRPLAPARELWITRPEAQESARIVYWADGALQAEGYRIINRLYRDLHADREQPIAIALLDLNHALQSAVAQAASARPIILLSGFRTAATNRLVGGVEPSAHETGQADDFIFERLSFTENIALARRFQVGGLGIYPDRGSLHKDLGALRTWVEYGRPALAPAPIRINPETAPPWPRPLSPKPLQPGPGQLAPIAPAPLSSNSSAGSR